MLDDLRDHAAAPTQKETVWIETSAFALMVRAAVLTTVALFIGISASIALESPAEAPRLAATVER